jgi:YD repeat-containing protein
MRSPATTLQDLRYTYDANGNITNKSDAGNYTYENTGYANPHAATTINGTTYSYDNAGNLTSAGSNTYVWDYANRLADTNANGTTTHYLYDHAGQRVEMDTKIGATTATAK